MEFSNTTTKNGLIQMLERRTNTQSATSSSYPLTDKTVDLNSALAHYMVLAISSEGRWQVDDTNQEDFPIIYGNIVSGQQDYTFLTDETGNQILDIYKVRIKDSNGNWRTLREHDLTGYYGNDFLNQEDAYLNDTTTGAPTTYDITGNGIFLHQIPNYTLTDALEVYINRTPSYFVSTDTTKKPGIPDVFHEYLVLRAAYFYCLNKNLPQAKNYYTELYGTDGRHGMEGMIKKYYSDRNRNERRTMRPVYESTR